MRLQVDAAAQVDFDAPVLCPPMEGADAMSVINPVVEVDVQSPSMGSWDVSGKRDLHPRHPSVQYYLEAHVEAWLVEHYLRLPDESWRVQVPGTTTWSVQLKISATAAIVTVDGKPAGVGIAVLASELAPGMPHPIGVIAEWFATHADSLTVTITITVTVTAGKRVVMRIPLVKSAATPVVAPTPRPTPTPTPAPQVTPTPVPDPTPAPAASTATVRFTSKPDGADVLVGGRMVGTTPVESEGPAEEKKVIEFRFEVYDPARLTITTPGAGARTMVEKTLQACARATGLLSVNVSSGWTEIWVDGKKVKTSPLFNHALPEGTHEVTAKNDALGMNETRKVTIKAGETASIGFKTP